MAKKYKIELNVVTSQSEAAANRMTAHFKTMEAKALAGTRAVERAADAAARSAEKLASQSASIALKAADRRVAIEEKAADRTRSIAEKAAARTQALAEAAAARKERSNTKLYTQEEAHARALIEVTRRKNDAAIKQELELMGVTGRRHANGWEGAERLIGSVQNLALSYVGLGTAVSVLKAIGDATKEAADAQEKHTSAYIQYRNTQMEVLAMSGKSVTSAETLAGQRFAADVGLESGKATAFRAAFAESGAQSRGKKISESAYGEFEKQAATYAAAQGIDPDVVGGLAGKVAGSREYTMEMDLAGAAMGDLNLAVKVLQRGSGNNAVLGKQIGKLSSFAQNPDQLLGTFNNWRESAVALSTAAEVNPEESEVYVRNAIKAIRPGEKDKSQELMAKAKVTPQDKFFAAYSKLAPVVLAEAREKKIDVGQVLKSYGMDEREAIAAGAFIGKGIGDKPAEGVIADRMAEADRNASPDVAKQIIAEAHTNPEGAVVHTKAAERTKLAGLERGAKTASVATLREQAEADLVGRGEETSFASDHWYNFSFGALEQAAGGLPAQEQRRTREMQKLLEGRADKQGIKLRKGAPTENGTIFSDLSTAGARDSYFNQQFSAFKEQGGNPLVDLTRQQVEEQRKANAIAEQQLQEQRKANTRPALPIPMGVKVGAQMGRVTN